MSVRDNQRANETTFNEAFVSRKQDTDLGGRLALKRDSTDSGAHVIDTQAELNSISSFLGKLLNGAKDLLPTWISKRRGSESSSIKDKIEAIDSAFAGDAEAGGHTHSGEEGEGAKISAAHVSISGSESLSRGDVQSQLELHEQSIGDLAGLVGAQTSGDNFLRPEDQNADLGAGNWVKFLERFPFDEQNFDFDEHRISLPEGAEEYTFREGTPVRFTEDAPSTLPLLVNKTYYVVNPEPGSFQVAETPEGPALELHPTGVPFGGHVFSFAIPSNGESTGAEPDGYFDDFGTTSEYGEVLSGTESYISGDLPSGGGVSVTFTPPLSARGRVVVVSFDYLIDEDSEFEPEVWLYDSDSDEIHAVSGHGSSAGGAFEYRGTVKIPEAAKELRLILYRGPGEDPVTLIWDSVHVSPPIDSRSVTVDSENIQETSVSDALETAFTSLAGKAAKGANSDITSIAGLKHLDIDSQLYGGGNPANGRIRIYALNDALAYRIGATGPEKKIGSGAGAGGGGSIQWFEAENAPIPVTEFGSLAYAFQTELYQRLYTMVRIPESYEAGTQVRFHAYCYSDETSKGAVFDLQVTRIRPGTDDLENGGSSALLLPSSPGIGFSPSTVNVPRKIEWIISANGSFGGSALKGGDLLRLRLRRDLTAPDAGTVKVPVYSSEIEYR